MIEEDHGFAMQQSIGNVTTIEQRYSHSSKHKTEPLHDSHTRPYSLAVISPCLPLIQPLLDGTFTVHTVSTLIQLGDVRFPMQHRHH